MPLTKVKSLGTENIGGGNRNIVINGAMQVAQRATSATGVGGSNGYFQLIDLEYINQAQMVDLLCLKHL